MQTTILGLHYLGLRQSPVFLFMFIKVQTLLLGDFSLLKVLMTVSEGSSSQSASGAH